MVYSGTEPTGLSGAEAGGEGEVLVGSLGNPAELVAWRADPNRPPALLVDARPGAEFTMSHINGAVWIDPAAPDLSVIANVPKDNPVVVYVTPREP